MSVTVRFEGRAFGDWRILGLAEHYGEQRYWAYGVMLVIWSICTERGSGVIEAEEVDRLMPGKDLSMALLLNGLAEDVEETPFIRIKGTEGRIEWYADYSKDAQR